jgi:3-deoxy-D-manno-octulosonate 8-phosphate phosphatase (KDO 8-P phosphatase)
MKKTTNAQLRRIAKDIKLLILDVDGVLTDGSIILDNEGNEFKAFHVRDGHGLKMLAKAGIRVAIITGRQSTVVDRRARELGIAEVYQKCYNKTAAYEHLLQKWGLSSAEVAYIGDDIVDISLLMKVGLPVAVADATQEAKALALLITTQRGGRGAVREVCELLLKSQDKWDDLLDEYHHL